MARKKDVNAEIKEVANEQVKDNSYKAWDERSNEEKKASINEYSKAIIAKAIKEKATFWGKDMSKKDIDNSMPYNASKGIAYTGQTSALLRAVSELNGYEKPSFLTMKQANFLGGTLKKQLDENGKPVLTKSGKEAYEQGVKIALLKTESYVPKLDENGQTMTRAIKDQNGNQKIGKDGKPMFEIVTEKIYHKTPILETVTLYHTSQFDNLKMDKLKERDLESLEKLRDSIKKSNYDTRPNINNLGLGEKVTRDINNFLNAELKGLDYFKIQDREITKTQTNEKEQNKSQGRGM
ncbi:ArdC-like ssDNA-binding domain-containing protein [Campylobacter coli]|uniref:ArdC-like ssDNA-binding domain-containing protein n=1 Tax=Campylobacter coli TaxID=195 RepID=UPI000930A8AE|nr:ArdC family protein [Campylobacter coli]